MSTEFKNLYYVHLDVPKEASDLKLSVKADDLDGAVLAVKEKVSKYFSSSTFSISKIELYSVIDGFKVLDTFIMENRPVKI